MIIGKFTLEKETYTGDIVAGFGALAAVAITPAATNGPGGPDYRVVTIYGELGAAWKKTSAKGNEYLSVKLDSPFLPAPVNCALVRQSGNTHALVWSRETRPETADPE
jgi:uncharacterized protein (DUF736 family)